MQDVNFYQTFDRHYLNNLFEKDPIAWPKMTDSKSCEELDSAVSNEINRGNKSENWNDKLDLEV